MNVISETRGYRIIEMPDGTFIENRKELRWVNGDVPANELESNPDMAAKIHDMLDAHLLSWLVMNPEVERAGEIEHVPPAGPTMKYNEDLSEAGLYYSIVSQVAFWPPIPVYGVASRQED